MFFHSLIILRFGETNVIKEKKNLTNLGCQRG